MSKKVVTQGRFRIEVNRPGSPPPDGEEGEYLKSRNLDGAVFFRTKKDDQPTAIGSGSESEQDRLGEALQQVLVDEVIGSALDGFGGDINIEFKL